MSKKKEYGKQVALYVNIVKIWHLKLLSNHQSFQTVNIRQGTNDEEVIGDLPKCKANAKVAANAQS